MGPNTNPWASFEPTASDPWDLGRVAHLHRRTGFGTTQAELLRDLRAGPVASVHRLLNPPEMTCEEQEVIAGLRRGVLASDDSQRLKAWWLYRILYSPDPLGEKMTLFWHSHFATSNLKVDSLPLMLQQNELLRRHALGEFPALLTAIIADPAMLVWLDGGNSLRERPNENFAREFLELFTLGPGNYTEADIRQAARAFTGWVRVNPERRDDAPAFRFDPAQFDDGSKTFLGRTGAWNAADIVRITLEQPAAAEFLCRKLYRYFVSEAAEPTPDLIQPLAAELRLSGYSIRHVLGIMLRSRHFYSQAVRRQRILSPVEFSVELVRMLEVPRSEVRLLPLAAACDRQGQELFYPPNVRGWVGGRTWLNSTTVLERGNWSNDVVWGNPTLDVRPYQPAAWAMQNNVAPAQTASALLDLLLQGDLHADNRARILRMAGQGTSSDALRRALQLALHCPEFQLG
jgi:uncharacterized protein (DUF1800 family)